MVRVTAPARLHLGFLDPDGVFGRRFASVGLAITEPATTLSLKRANKNQASGLEQARVTKLLTRFQDALKINGQFDVTVNEAIPSHAGLGSGTQLALAIGAALQTSAGNSVSPEQLGTIVDRGARSAIGMAAFADGGFVVDGGKKQADRPPPVVARVPFPDHWRIVLAFDHDAQGVHGEREHEAFAELKPLPREMAADLCHMTLMQMLPALHDADLDTFGQAVTDMQTIIGNYFAPAQGGGAFLSRRVEAVVRQMGARGGTGLGQSSWGPTGFAFFDSADAAERLYTTLVEDAKASGVDLKIVQGRNSGAQITAA